MEDIICLSSGSDDDSDLEVISSYNEDKEDGVPFIRTEWLPVTPVSLLFAVCLYQSLKVLLDFVRLGFYRLLPIVLSITHANRRFVQGVRELALVSNRTCCSLFTQRADNWLQVRWYAHK